MKVVSMTHGRRRLQCDHYQQRDLKPGGYLVHPPIVAHPSHMPSPFPFLSSPISYYILISLQFLFYAAYSYVIAPSET